MKDKRYKIIQARLSGYEKTLFECSELTGAEIFRLGLNKLMEDNTSPRLLHLKSKLLELEYKNEQLMTEYNSNNTLIRKFQRDLEILESKSEYEPVLNDGEWYDICNITDSYDDRRIPSYIRRHILSRDELVCNHCGVKIGQSDELTSSIDHIIPFSKGGSHEPYNLQVLCNICNSEKRDYDGLAIDKKKLDDLKIFYDIPKEYELKLSDGMYYYIFEDDVIRFSRGSLKRYDKFSFNEKMNLLR